MDHMEKFGLDLFSRYCQNFRKQEQKYWEIAEVVDLTPNNAPAQVNDTTQTSSSAQENNASENIQETVTESSTQEE